MREKKKEASDYRDGAEGFFKWMEENVCLPIIPFGSMVPKWTLVGELPDDIHPETGKSYKSLWDTQKDVVREGLKMVGGEFAYRMIVFCWPRGEGKCQQKGSKVLMFDGSIKKVEEVAVGDSLMGDDNMPRRVLSLANGKEEMYEVTPFRGEKKVITADHILSLMRRRSRHNKRNKPFEDLNAGKIVDITLREYQKQNKWFKDLHLLYRIPIEWPKQEVDIDPYFLGLWLGDGSSTAPEITTMDKEIVDYLSDFADKNGMKITKNGKAENRASTYKIVSQKIIGQNRNNRLLTALRELNLVGNKHIPQIYKANSRDVRLKLLAGLVDSDGYINRNSIQITLKVKQLADDAVFLARSLGFHAEIKKCKKGIKSSGFCGEYYTVGVSGDCSIIPTIITRKRCRERSKWKNVLVTGIKEVKSVGDQEYYGFSLDGNGRYVTSDFTVTHNSLMVVCIELWRFFNFPRQKIVCGANSKDQVQFVHYDLMKDIINNSPNLLAIIGKKNVREKSIAFRDGDNNIQSEIMTISSFSGIVSNINSYTFSEMFDQKNPKFFVQLDGSIRNIPNAMGCIDSTVSTKDHILRKLYESSRSGADPSIFFSYRCSKKGVPEDYMNPNMTLAQINSYRAKFPFGDFERYFLNLWESAGGKVFSREQVEAIHYFGVDHKINTHRELIQLIKKKNDTIDFEDEIKQRNISNNIELDTYNVHAEFKNRVWPVESIFRVRTYQNQPIMPTMKDLDALSDIYDTNWAIIACLDRGDPMKTKTSARTILSFAAKGLVGSRSRPQSAGAQESTMYLHILLYLVNIEDHSLEAIKTQMQLMCDEFDGIDVLGGERYGAWDLQPWCEERNIILELWLPSYNRQKEMFGEFFTSVEQGCFKAPPLAIAGYVEDDILVEEMSIFDHIPPLASQKAGWFGSPEKMRKNGPQDDAMYTMGGLYYAGRQLSILDFKERKGRYDFGTFFANEGLLGDYR